MYWQQPFAKVIKSARENQQKTVERSLFLSVLVVIFDVAYALESLLKHSKDALHGFNE